MPRFTRDDFGDLVERVSREIARRLARTWDFGLEEDIERLLDEGRFADALLLAAEIESRWREGCDGSVASEQGHKRAGEWWLRLRAEETARTYGLPAQERPEKKPGGDQAVSGQTSNAQPSNARASSPRPTSDHPASAARTRLERFGVRPEAIV